MDESREQLRHRAQDYRRLAGETKDQALRETLRELAENYESLANSGHPVDREPQAAPSPFQRSGGA